MTIYRPVVQWCNFKDWLNKHDVTGSLSYIFAVNCYILYHDPRIQEFEEKFKVIYDKYTSFSTLDDKGTRVIPDEYKQDYMNEVAEINNIIGVDILLIDKQMLMEYKQFSSSDIYQIISFMSTDAVDDNAEYQAMMNQE